MVARSRNTLLGVAATLVAATLLLAVPPAGADTAAVHRDLDYTLEGNAGPDPLRKLDLYVPPVGPGQLRPVVVYVHGGGWSRGDKSNRISDKANLFNGMGYLFASVNYRLSPRDIDPSDFDPARIRFPVHPADVGEAIAWISRNAAAYGGDPDRIVLVGHSAGAQLVSLIGTDPTYHGRFGVSPLQVRGVVSLDTDAFDLTKEADPAVPGNGPQNLALLWNAFATPQENASDGTWAEASPRLHADPGDPDFLLVAQASKPARLADNREMAAALGQDPATSVIPVPLDHEGINRALGSPDDTSGETPAVRGFVRDVAEATPRPAVSIRKRPAKRVRIGGKATKRKVRFAFAGNRFASAFQCRIDRRPFVRCRSPKRYRLARGRHVFKVRPLSPSGRPAAPATKVIQFRIIGKRVLKKNG